MNNDFEKAMAELLSGSKTTTTTKAIKIFAMDIDRKFAGVDEKLDSILHLLKINNSDTDKRIEAITGNCNAHKAEINKKFSDLDSSVETINYFSKHPYILKFVGVAVLVIISYIAGHSTSIDIFKLLK